MNVRARRNCYRMKSASGQRIYMSAHRSGHVVYDVISVIGRPSLKWNQVFKAPKATRAHGCGNLRHQIECVAIRSR